MLQRYCMYVDETDVSGDCNFPNRSHKSAFSLSSDISLLRDSRSFVSRACGNSSIDSPKVLTSSRTIKDAMLPMTLESSPNSVIRRSKASCDTVSRAASVPSPKARSANGLGIPFRIVAPNGESDNACLAANRRESPAHLSSDRARQKERSALLNARNTCVKRWGTLASGAVWRSGLGAKLSCSQAGHANAWSQIRERKGSGSLG